MHLNPYGEYAVRLAQSLANDPPTDRREVVDRTRTHGMTMRYVHRPDDFERCVDVVGGWLAVVDAPSATMRADLLNEQMAAVSAVPRLTDHDGEGWHLHYRDVDDLPGVLQSVITVGTALHLTTRGMSRLRRCASDPCRAVVVDTSRNGTQRYCSTTCGTRAAVRRHRASRR